MLKQNQNQPLRLEQEVSILFALLNGYLDDVDIDKVQAFEEAMHSYMESSHPEVLQTIADEKELTDESETALHEALKSFKESVPY